MHVIEGFEWVAALLQAWDTLFWFAVLVGMSGQLNSLGVISYFSDSVGAKLTSLNMGWPSVFGLLNLVYFGLHYMFASQTAHVGALYAAFLAMMVASGVYAQKCDKFGGCASSEGSRRTCTDSRIDARRRAWSLGRTQLGIHEQPVR